MAMSVLGNGLTNANHYEDALSVKEAELSMMRRLGAPEDIFSACKQSCTYAHLWWSRTAGKRLADVARYSGNLRLKWRGTWNDPHGAANNYAFTLIVLQRFEETRTLLRKRCPWRDAFLGE